MVEVSMYFLKFTKISILRYGHPAPQKEQSDT